MNFFSAVKTTAAETAIVKNAVTFKGTIAHVENSQRNSSVYLDNQH